ncbi:DinB family protein [Deinococcus irradiatisoli]|uniref:DinB family protein n=1 Tax=Deinococcus irradiatisoli TaxID=2202254 RepID=A0A2Z3JDK3_9DEIO|nr:DinB family protein [Deinococcus irradiatisoli]AWN23122.1 DinB family protein [Deinococcus irradiatisoli]
MHGDLLFGPPPDTLQRLLAPTEFAPLKRLLGGLSGEQATAHLPGAPHSIAEIAAHLLGNLRFNLDLIEGRAPETRADWPGVSAAQWPELAQALLDVDEKLRGYASRPEVLERVIFPATAGEPGWTAGYKLAVNVGLHNAYHFGQIVTLRQLLGAWPGTP